jgi:hypothetical protein
MHCKACDRLLTDFEATRKYADGTYVDLCKKDFASIASLVRVVEREDLKKEEPFEYDDASERLDDSED